MGSELDLEIWAHILQAFHLWQDAVPEEGGSLEVVDAFDLAHCSLTITHCSQPGRHGPTVEPYKSDAPLRDIAGLAAVCIDAALIGPVCMASELIAADPCLLAAARTRAMFLPTGERWRSRVSEIVARAESIVAAQAMEGVLNAI